MAIKRTIVRGLQLCKIINVKYIRNIYREYNVNLEINNRHR